MTKDLKDFHVSRNVLLGISILSASMGAVSANPYVDALGSTQPYFIHTSMQQNKITVVGIVKDASGPLTGVNVIEKGTTNGTITDLDGKFTLNVSPKAVLVMSFIGYKDLEVKVNNRNSLNVKMSEDTQALEEIVVVGYGTQKKVNLTGSVSSVDFKEQALSRPVTNVSNALAGMSAGVQVSQGSGKPGSDGSYIRIRGLGTLNNASPLVLVDGVEGSMDLVNPQDIENISVLKDAASSSIYGARAANGVILITTKKGKSGKLNVSYSGRFSYAKPTNLIEQVTDYADYMTLMNESLENLGQANHYSQSTIDTWREKSKDPNGLNEHGVPNYIAYPNTNWQDYLFGNGIINDHNISLNGGNDRLRVLMSAGYLDNPGLVDRTGIKKYSLRANIEADVTKWLKVGTRTFASHQDQEVGNFDNANNFLRQACPGVFPEWNGKYGAPEAPEEFATANSIGWFLNSNNGKQQATNFNTTLYTSIIPIKGLSWDFNLNYRRYWYDRELWSNPLEKVRFSDGKVMIPATDPAEMTTSFNTTNDYSYTIQNLVRYNTTIRKDHDLGVMLGYEEFYFKRTARSASKKGLIDESIHTLGSATEMLGIGGGVFDRARRSFFARLNYAYKSRYLFEGNIRHDGDARYHKDYRWGNFPSFSAAWRISEEAFMEQSRNWLDNLKLRISYGSVGNNGGGGAGEYEYQSTYGIARYPLGGKLYTGLASTSLANSMLSWETSTMTNFGIDINAFKNRLTATVDAFYKKTTGILYKPSIYLTAGNKNAPRKNIAEMNTKGVEITIGWQDQIDDFHYSVSGNFSYTPNKVTKYKGKYEAGYDENGVWHTNIGDVASNAGSVSPIVEGHTAGEFFLREPYKGTGKGYTQDGANGGPRDGMIRTEQDMEWLKAMIDAGNTFMPNKKIEKSRIWYGDYVYADANGDGIYGGSDDRKFQNVSSAPKFNFGFQMSATWKGVDVSMNWAGAAGNKLFWGPTTGYNCPITRIGCAIDKDIAADHYFYNPENPSDPRTNLNAEYGRLLNGESAGHQNVYTSTLYLFNANYLKLKNLTIGYTFPKAWTNKIKMENARLYLSIENVFNITKFPGQDPEMGAYPAYTSLRQFAFGVNISF